MGSGAPLSTNDARRIRQAVRATAVVSVFGYLSQVGSLIAIPVYLHAFGAEGYGLMLTVLALTGYLGFADAGLSWSTLILVAQANGHSDRNEIAHVVRHGLALGVCSAAIAATVLIGVLIAAAHGWRLCKFSRW